MEKLIRQMIREMIEQLPDVRTIKVGGYPITVEIATTPEHQETGLMRREHLDPDSGMLFCYDEPRELSFWMRDTHVPLSIAFIDDECKVSSIHDMEPYDETRTISTRPCRWALETNRGWFRERNIGIGSKISGLDV
jgi:uncharacterized membrane protein (UPF0127 family)